MSVSAPLKTPPALPLGAEALQMLNTWAENLLFYGFMFYTFLGTGLFSPSSVESRVEGSLLDRIVVLSLLALALVVLIVRRSEVSRCFLANLPLFALTAFCVLSILWSDYPGLTLRRALLLLFIVVICLAVAMSARSLRQLHTRLFASLAVVIVLNLVMTVLMPDVAISEIGVRGIYSQKNVAGIVAMITVVLGVTWLLDTNRWSARVAGLAMVVLALIFLVITRSKTSINLTGLGLLIIAYFAVAEKIGAWFILVTGFVSVMLIATTLAFLAMTEFDFSMLLEAAVGDRSFSGRDELWAFARREALKRPWLGHGYGAFWDVGIANDPLAKLEPGTWLASVQTGVINQAHNGYLELALHVGVPMMVVGASIVCFGALSAGLRATFGSETRGTRAAAGGFALVLILHLLHNFTEATLFMRGAQFCSTVLVLLMVLSRGKSDPAPETGWVLWQTAVLHR